MKTTMHLVVNSRGMVKATKTKPGARYDEVILRLDLELPDALFKKPLLVATVSVPDSAATPTEISAEVVQNIQDAIHSAAGLDVRIEVATVEETKDSVAGVEVHGSSLA